KAETNGDVNGEVIDRVIALGGEVWLSLAKWGRETRNLEPPQRTVASGLARTINSNRRPSPRQAVEGENALDAARKKGFKLPAPGCSESETTVCARMRSRT